jgi:hypothetical protein
VSNAVEQARERLPSGEREDGVDTAGRERECRAARSCRRPSAAASAPRRRTNAMPSRPDAVARTRAPRIFANWSARLPTPPAGAVNHDRLAALDMQDIVYSLDRGETRRGNGSCFREAEIRGRPPDLSAATATYSA